ncbi:MAG: hypothetical protein DME07_21850 [Candidatus Rokuibacteriota bacterium]|nr:MAG: hypothetical protein DME07_21850 [Candidatus Rokubacteria bacterium]PYN56229.1 MAG: hypothetical protein DMD94_08520 [Candidatus Rokubacteria bacterium]
MEQRVGMEDLLRRIRREIRRRRAEFYGLRGAFWGGMAGLVVLLVKQGVGGTAPWVAGGLVLVGALAGLVYGAARRIDRLDTARVADRAFGLHDRVATTLEWAERTDRTPLVEALVADTRARVEALQMKRVVRHELPGEARFLPLPLLACLVLALMPPIPMPSGRFPDMLSGGEEDREDRTRSTMLEETTRALAKDALKRSSFEERDFAQRAGGSGATTAGDLSAIFKDTSLANQRPDFNSFLKKGDERLKMLEQMDRVPDLQSDFTSSNYKMVFRKSKALTGGLKPNQISPQKLRELLEEMERLGRKGGNWGGDAMEGMEALEGGQTDRALEAMQKALEKMRAMDDAERSGKGLRGGRENERGSRSRDRGRGDGMGGDEQDFGEGEGLMPGRGRSGSPKGEATQRLRANPYDVGVEGESRRGKKEGFDTNMTGRGGSMASRLQYLGIIGQYRKQMEDAITREQVPRDYHDQIRNYFQSLDER